MTFLNKHLNRQEAFSRNYLSEFNTDSEEEQKFSKSLLKNQTQHSCGFTISDEPIIYVHITKLRYAQSYIFPRQLEN